VKSAFLNVYLDEEIYMVCPLGFEVPGHVCKPLKSIYGLKQAAMVWAERLKRYLVKAFTWMTFFLLQMILESHQNLKDFCRKPNSTVDRQDASMTFAFFIENGP
jgi:hypothetical protein